jgi:hypothetical protein
VLTRLHHRTMLRTLDVRAAGACAPRGIRIPATALKGRRPRPLDDGGSDLHREHRIVAAAIRTSSGEYGAKRLDRQGERCTRSILWSRRPRLGDDLDDVPRSRRPGSTGKAAQSSSFCATAKSLQGEIQDLDSVDLTAVSVSEVKSTYRRFARDVARAGKDVSRLFTYLEDQCGVTFESPTTAT